MGAGSLVSAFHLWLTAAQRCGKLKDRVTDLASTQHSWEHLCKISSLVLARNDVILPQLQLVIHVAKGTHITFHGLDAGISAIKLMAHTSIYYNFGSFKNKMHLLISNSTSQLWIVSRNSLKIKLMFQQSSGELLCSEWHWAFRALLFSENLKFKFI